MIREVINTHEQILVSGVRVAIVQARGGLSGHFQGWGIYLLNEQGKLCLRDKKGHWQNNYMVIFNTMKYEGSTQERKTAALEAAKKFVAERGWYTGEWVRNRLGDYIPVQVNKDFPLRKK